jgi:flavorubredoxin
VQDIISICDDIHYVGVNDRITELFESLWPIPRGISYNSYLILDEKVALIDTVKGILFDEHLAKLKKALGDRKIDYLVVNHMEPDHTGSLRLLREIFPAMQIIGSEKAGHYLKDLYEMSENVRTVDKGETINLGTHSLKFILTPMVHWPETMMTYEERSNVLFSGDGFGGFGALDDGIFDDQMDISCLEDEMLRYFANVIAKYSTMVQRAIKKLEHLEIRMVASTHGPVWRKDPKGPIEYYDRWSRQEAEKGVVIVYGSMYGNTERMMEAVARGLAREGLQRVHVHNVSKVHLSYIMADIWRHKGIVLGGPTYNTKLFPLLENLTRILENDRLKDRLVGIFGSYGWGGGGVKALKEFAEAAKLELVEPVVEAKFAATTDEINNCVLLGRNIAKAVKASFSQQGI